MYTNPKLNDKHAMNVTASPPTLEMKKVTTKEKQKHFPSKNSDTIKS